MAILRLIEDRKAAGRILTHDWSFDCLNGSVPGNRVSTFPLATKVVVTVTTKLAIPKGHRAGDVVGVGGNARIARGDEGGGRRRWVVWRLKGGGE